MLGLPARIPTGEIREEPIGNSEFRALPRLMTERGIEGMGRFSLFVVRDCLISGLEFRTPQMQTPACPPRMLSVPVLLVIPDHPQNVGRLETTDGPGAVTGHFDGARGPDHKTRGLEIQLLRFIKPPEKAKGRFRVQAMGHGKGEPQLVDGLLRFRESVHRAREYPHVFGLELVQVSLEVSQLLTAEGSPVSPVEKNHSVAPSEVLIN